MKPKKPINWSQRRPFVTALLWALVPSFVAFWIGPTLSDKNLKTAVYTGAATLLFGGLLGGVLKVLLDDIVAAKRRREDAADFVAKVLADLKGVYDRVGRAGILIPAHKSVNTYGDEMRGMIEARVQLRNITRALERRAEGVSEDARKTVTHRVNRMKQYLDELTGEFRDHYKALSDKQRGYEERAKVLLKDYAGGSGEEQPPQLPGFVWESLSQLPMLEDFIAWGQKYRRGFEEPLDTASALLRNEHARILGGRGGMGTTSPGAPSMNSSSLSHSLAANYPKVPDTLDTRGKDYMLPSFTDPDPTALAGKRVLMISADGPELPEISVPTEYLEARGAEVTLAAQNWIFEYRDPPGHIVIAQWLADNICVKADLALREVQVAKWDSQVKTFKTNYDALFIPGGAWNPDMLRIDTDALRVVREARTHGLLIVSLCHGPQVLITAGRSDPQGGVVFPPGTRITGVESIRVDLENAGYAVFDRSTVYDPETRLLTARDPDDLGPLCEEMGRLLSQPPRA